ncbi:sulfite exporter TauE/SafE family protein [Sphingorhabdus sp.]|uniref:sulfite exporter TauE/SafE family protein n=1 Tax=Sphingorhabdus sp. TaxID=1902408 RepID=UPI0035B1C9F8|nr:sulfite exporter TauE/SafE family protein [Sphingomonadaceae bacterium]
MTVPADTAFWLVAGLAILLVGLAKGGFAGLGAVSMPLIALVMDPVQGAAMLLPILMVQDVVSVWSFRKEYDRALLWQMLPGAALGIFLGWLFANSVSTDAVKGLVGLIALAFGLYRLVENRLGTAGWAMGMPAWVGTFWGGVAGFTSHVAHAGGPPFQIWALSRNLPHTIFIGSSAIFFAAVNYMKVPAYLALGQFTTETLWLTAYFMPLAILSTFAGVVLVRRVSPERFYLAINLLMIAVGTELVREALF